MFGYARNTLLVDLTRGKIQTRKLKMDLARSFLGGKGMGAKLLYEKVAPHIEPLSPQNALIVATGPFTGTPVPGGCKFVLVTKSPLTNIFLDTNCGGMFGPFLRFAGYDIILIEGRAKNPCFLYIEDGTAELRNAEHLWGQTTHETENIIQKEVNRSSRIASIGPAGEKMVRFAGVTSNYHRHAGRGGAGAVLGSKKLKAIAVFGTKSVPVAASEELRRQATELRNQNPLDVWGTPGAVRTAQDTSSLPTRNYQAGVFEGAEKIGAEAMREQIVVQDVACFGCSRACGKLVLVKSGPWKGTRLVGPEYETLGMLGANCGIDNLGAIAHANLLCDQLGIDTISTGGVIGFVMECYERGILTRKEVDGLDLRFGNAEAMIELVRKIGLREGIGDLLADGVKRVAERIGKGSERFAVHVKGAELPAWEARGARGRGLMYALSECGGFHTKGWVGGVEPPDKSAVDKVEGFIRSQSRNALLDSIGLCQFILVRSKEQVNLLNLITGWELTLPEYFQTGERIHNLTRAFNVREGFSRKEDRLPPRIMNEPTPKGEAAGCKAFISEEDFEKCLDEYYHLREWDKNGKPTYKTLVRLGLREIADDLRRRKIIT